MSGYGKVISGGAQVSKPSSKPINKKIDGYAQEQKRRAVVAGAVRQAFTVRHLSDQTTNNSNNGKFQTVSAKAKVQP
jgi:hypothetical protein